MKNPDLNKRKGAKRRSEVPVEVLKALNSGTLETVNLVEWLSVNQLELVKNVLQKHQRVDFLAEIEQVVLGLKKPTVTSINDAIGKTLGKIIFENDDLKFLTILKDYNSDFVRGWAAIAIANQSLEISEKLQQILPLAIDSHFGVREIAWISIRPSVSEFWSEAKPILEEWAKSCNENQRRFASEVSRPRGVWCLHIPLLKNEPEQGISILNPLKSDESKYVRDSVGNWLNDASKSKPDFVQQICKTWLEESPTKETAYIVKKALRTITKTKSLNF